jgi:hypothetical protein
LKLCQLCTYAGVIAQKRAVSCRGSQLSPGTSMKNTDGKTTNVGEANQKLINGDLK